MTSKKREKPVVLFNGLDHVQGLLAENLLTEAGIPCMLHGPDHGVGTFDPPTHDNIFGRQLLVSPEFVERARKVLEETWGEEACRKHSPG